MQQLIQAKSYVRLIPADYDDHFFFIVSGGFKQVSPICQTNQTFKEIVNISRQ